MRHSPAIRRTAAPPIMAARAWMDEVPVNPDLPLLDLSQAAPTDPPPPELREEIARIARDMDASHLYGPVLGHPDLRAEIAGQWSRAYGGQITTENVAITAGCNQAFCAAIAATAGAGDNVVLPSPWYFNHKMALDMAGIECRPLPCDGNMVPDPVEAAALIDARTRALVLVSPNNPTGAVYPPKIIARFADLARAHDAALILDETYRDYHDGDRPHALFAANDWGDTLIHLYSFSKAYRLTGHRIGALIAGAPTVSQVEKYLDTVSICANQIGQHAALFGLRRLGDFVARERARIRSRQRAAQAHLATRHTAIASCGAYFAYLRHDLPATSLDLAKRLLQTRSLLILPGTMFCPAGDDPDRNGDTTLRVAFANADEAGIADCARRLSVLAQ